MNLISFKTSEAQYNNTTSYIDGSHLATNFFKNYSPLPFGLRSPEQPLLPYKFKISVSLLNGSLKLLLGNLFWWHRLETHKFPLLISCNDKVWVEYWPYACIIIILGKKNWNKNIQVFESPDPFPIRNFCTYLFFKIFLELLSG